MSQERATPSADDCFFEIQDQVAQRTPDAIVEAISTQLALARNARSRIVEEGAVVRDMRGSVIPHPAIKVEADAIKLYTALIAKHKRF